MSLRDKLLALALVLLLKPACGGGGGGGGSPGGSALSFPALPAVVAQAPAQGANLATSAYPPTPLDTSAPTTTVVIHPGDSDTTILAALQPALTTGGKVTISVVAGSPRTVVVPTPLQIGTTPTILDGGFGGGHNLLVLSGGGGGTGIFQLAYHATFTVQQVDFIDARSAQDGAAIAGPDGGILGLTVTNCNFTNCQTQTAGPDHGGGAIRAWNSLGTTISGCTFTKCAASNGGAVNSLGSPLTIVECNFIQNAAFGTGGGQDAGPSGQGGIGGAVYVDNVSNGPTPANYVLAISGCLFNANVANDQGGAVFGYMNPAKATSKTVVDATTFAGNVVLSTSDAGGGAFYSLNDTLTLTNSTFNANSSGSVAGALRCDNTTTTVTNCTFQGNSAGTLGGAVGRFSGTSLTLQNVTVAQNTAGTFSGGIFWDGTGAGDSATVNGSIFYNNTGVNAFNGWQTNITMAGGGNLQFPTVNATNQLAISGATLIQSDPLLSALANNTGPTYTMAISSISPARNPAAYTGAPADDQRGVVRDAQPDYGAYE